MAIIYLKKLQIMISTPKDICFVQTKDGGKRIVLIVIEEGTQNLFRPNSLVSQVNDIFMADYVYCQGWYIGRAPSISLANDETFFP